MNVHTIFLNNLILFIIISLSTSAFGIVNNIVVFLSLDKAFINWAICFSESSISGYDEK